MSLGRPRGASALALLASGLVVALSPGCAGVTHARAPGLDARVDRRVAVLPFAARHDGDHPGAVPLALLVDALPLLHEPSAAAERGPERLRARVHAELEARTGFELVPLPAIDAGLAAAGLDVASVGSLDGPGRARAARRLGEATGADALLFGVVTAWGREFWGLQAHATVGVALELRDAATGEVLFVSEAEDTAHSGVSQLPLPIVTDPLEVPAWLLLELLRGLSTSMFLRLADDVAALAVEGLSTHPEDDDGPAAPPRVELAAASLDPAGPLVVVARGTPGALAAFRVAAGGWIPMAECAPGTYRGSLLGGPRGDRVAVRLLGEGGGADEVGLPGSGEPPGAPGRVLARGARLVLLTPRGPVPAEVAVPRGDDLVLLDERLDGPVAVVLARGDPRREAGGGPALTPVPLGPGELLVVPCDVPGACALEVHAAAGPPADVRVVVAPR